MNIPALLDEITELEACSTTLGTLAVVFIVAYILAHQQ